MVPTNESPAPVVSTTLSAFSALIQIGFGLSLEAIAAPLLPEMAWWRLVQPYKEQLY